MLKRRILGAGVAVLLLGCSSPFERMRAEIKDLQLPEGYEFLWENESGSRFEFFGSLPRLTRRYTAPRSFEETCKEVRSVASVYSSGGSNYYEHRVGEGIARCIAPFTRRGGLSGGLTAVNPSEGGEVRVIVQIIQH